MVDLENRSVAVKNKVIILLCVLLLAAMTASWVASSVAMENHECLVSVTAREILVNKDWVMPTCNAIPRLEKTPLCYWLVAGLSKMTGEIDELTARLPSIIFAVLSVGAIIYFVNRWLRFRTAIISALVWATSFSYIKYAHSARPAGASTVLMGVHEFVAGL